MQGPAPGESIEQEVESRKRAWGCRNVDVYMKLNNISEGAYGVVSRGQDTKTGTMVALKRLKMDRLGKGVFIFCCFFCFFYRKQMAFHSLLCERSTPC
jgi:serine/threonine protein kinase